VPLISELFISAKNMPFHRYGRHGPEAWRHRHKRKYIKRHSVALIPVAPTNLFVRIVVPSTTERVVVIIMPENGIPEKATEPEVTTIVVRPGGESIIHSALPPTRYGGGELSPGDSSLLNHAEWSAQCDAEEVKDLTRNGRFVFIDDSRIETHVGNLVRAFFEKSVETPPRPSSPEYKAKREKYKEAYLRYLREALYQEHAKMTYLSTTTIEARLRDLAIQDRNKYPSPWRRQFHQRDLAVVRVLLELSIHFDCAEQELENIHTHADIYEDYYANPREEVKWPRASF